MSTSTIITSISFLKKHPNISLEQFYTHWETVHGPLVKPWMEKHGFISYTQVHAVPALNETAPIGPEVRTGNPLAAFDGTAVIEVPSLECLTKAFADEYYHEVIARDEEKFLDRDAGVLRIKGYSKKIVKVL